MSVEWDGGYDAPRALRGVSFGERMAGGYRDEREAAMAANEVLQRENAELKEKLEALEAAAREGGLVVPATAEPKESSATTWAIVAVAVLLCTAFVGFFYVMRPTG